MKTTTTTTTTMKMMIMIELTALRYKVKEDALYYKLNKKKTEKADMEKIYTFRKRRGCGGEGGG